MAEAGKITHETLGYGVYNVEYVDAVVAAIKEKFRKIDNLGLYVPGPYTLRESENDLNPVEGYVPLPNNADCVDLDGRISLNDFATVVVKKGEEVQFYRYVVSNVALDGTLSWVRDIRYDTDITGLMELVPNAGEGNVAVFGSNGQVVDSGVNLANKMSEVAALKGTASSLRTEIDGLPSAYIKEMSPVGTDSPGISTEYARGDHSHPSGWVFDESVELNFGF